MRSSGVYIVLALIVLMAAVSGCATCNTLSIGGPTPIAFVPTQTPKATPTFSAAASATPQPGYSGPTPVPGVSSTPTYGTLPTAVPGTSPAAEPGSPPAPSPSSAASPGATFTPPPTATPVSLSGSGSSGSWPGWPDPDEEINPGYLFDWEYINWVEYLVNVDGDDFTLRVGFVKGTIGDTPAEDEQITIDDHGTRYEFHTYFNRLTHQELGGHVIVTENGVVKTDEYVASVDYTIYLGLTGAAYLGVLQEYASGRWPLIPVGQDTATYNGVACNCTKYKIGGNADQGYAWIARDVPVPVMMVRDNWEANAAAQLTGWG